MHRRDRGKCEHVKMAKKHWKSLKDQIPDAPDDPTADEHDVEASIDTALRSAQDGRTLSRLLDRC